MGLQSLFAMLRINDECRETYFDGDEQMAGYHQFGLQGDPTYTYRSITSTSWSNDQPRRTPFFSRGMMGSIIMHNRYLICLGGRDAQIRNEMNIYDFVAKKWLSTRMPELALPIGLAQPSLCVIGDTLYSFGMSIALSLCYGRSFNRRCVIRRTTSPFGQ
jgi:hypothetical protein